jgi:VIT1/CCC1 family predicted Fe2+/Mn2+ transporter
MLLSLVISTIAYFVAAHYIKRYMDGIDIPKGMVRSMSVFVLAAAVSYGVAFAVDLVVH